MRVLWTCVVGVSFLRIFGGVQLFWRMLIARRSPAIAAVWCLWSIVLVVVGVWIWVMLLPSYEVIRLSAQMIACVGVWMPMIVLICGVL